VSTTAEMAVYVDSIKLLLLSPSAVAYAEHLLECTTKTWSQPFARHWLDVIHPSIHLLGAWEQRKYGEELLTTNRSESFNAALKKLQQWKEAPVDGLALVLFRMAESYHAEIQRGHAGRCLV